MGMLTLRDTKIMKFAFTTIAVASMLYGLASLAGIASDWNLETRVMPFMGGDSSSLRGWCAHRTPHAGDPEAILALLDAWPAPVLQMGAAPFPASTVRWTCHFVEHALALGSAPVGYAADTVAAGEGYASFTARLGYDGRLVAFAEQLVAVFDG